MVADSEETLEGFLLVFQVSFWSIDCEVGLQSARVGGVLRWRETDLEEVPLREVDAEDEDLFRDVSDGKIGRRLRE